MSAVVELKNVEADFCELSQKYPFLFKIKNKSHYKKALDLLETIMTQTHLNEPLMLTLSNTISEYEYGLESVKRLEASVAKIPSGVAAIRVLMDQYGLTLDELPELGKKSSVSLILSGKRKLNLNHVKALVKRFNVSPALFLS